MTSVEQPAAVVVERAGSRWERVERWGRLLLALSWVSLMLSTVWVGQRESSLLELEAQVQAGDVTEVRVSDGLGPGASGWVTVRVAWRRGVVT